MSNINDFPLTFVRASDPELYYHFKGKTLQVFNVSKAQLRLLYMCRRRMIFHQAVISHN